MTTITSFRWTSIFSYFVNEYIIILWEFPTSEEVKESGWEKREKKKNFCTPFRWIVLISGTGLVLVYRSDFESYYGFGSWQISLVISIFVAYTILYSWIIIYLMYMRFVRDLFIDQLYSLSHNHTHLYPPQTEIIFH